jgi:diaminohydroxyphosphoribosylaminopyrimidine deaminase/5-amino-6-(5-phosphoribosylamino)uracil reductase
VLVRDGEVIAEGATGPFPVGPHAEVAALNAAGDRARGATAYVTLEPCNHTGNTPPCTEALIAAGVTRVVAAIGDPDERVRGTGFARLQEAGIDVVAGVGEEWVRGELQYYLHHRRTGRPFVTVKLAMSIDGRVAAADGTSQWITDEFSRSDVHELRADANAIVVGAGTAIADQPQLTVRGEPIAPQYRPLRVVFDARGRVPATGPLFEPNLAPTLIVTTDAAPSDAVDAWTAGGAKVETVAPAPKGVDLKEALAVLGRHGVLHALVEGGGTLVGSLIDAELVDRLVVYMAPMLLGLDGTPAFAMRGPESLWAAPKFVLWDTKSMGPDIRLTYEAVR